VPKIVKLRLNLLKLFREDCKSFLRTVCKSYNNVKEPGQYYTCRDWWLKVLKILAQRDPSVDWLFNGVIPSH